MSETTYYCNNCEAEFTIDYDDTVLGEEPSFCPFCSDLDIEQILEDLEDDDED